MFSREPPDGRLFVFDPDYLKPYGHRFHHSPVKQDAIRFTTFRDLCDPVQPVPLIRYFVNRDDHPSDDPRSRDVVATLAEFYGFDFPDSLELLFQRRAGGLPNVIPKPDVVPSDRQFKCRTFWDNYNTF